MPERQRPHTLSRVGPLEGWISGVRISTRSSLTCSIVEDFLESGV